MKTKTLLIMLVVFLYSISTFSQTDLNSKVRELFNLMNTEEQYEQLMDQMIDMQKSRLGENLDDELWDSLAKSVKEISFEEVYEMMIPIYTKHLTEADIDGMIAFYKSEVGQNLLRKMPLIMQESMMASLKISDIMMKNFEESLEKSKE